MDRRTHLNDVTPRRGFFTRVAASVMAIGLTGLGPVAARAAAGAEDGPDWPAHSRDGTVGSWMPTRRTMDFRSHLPLRSW